MSRVIGIDLGTTNSCVSILEGRDVIVIPNREGTRTTSSVVSFKANGERLVGQVAKRQAAKEPKGVVYAIKRLIGRTFEDPECQKIAKTVSYEIVPIGEGEQRSVGVRVYSKVYSIQELSAFILMHMREIAEEYLGSKVSQAVITVPAYFNDSQRQATRDAGRIAGLEVLRVINEPTAASLAYGLGEDRNETIAVYDFGGGTFDISILRLGDGLYEVLSTTGDTFLGGEDFDNAIIEKLIEEFKQCNGVDLRDDMAAFYRLKDAAESAKQELSLMSETEINLPFLTMHNGSPLHLLRSISRDELEALTENLVRRTLGPCQQALDDAKLQRSDITQIVLVGGMTRMPLVRKMVSDFFGREIKSKINPDEVVSVGASVQGGVLCGEIEEVILMDVTPLTLGVETAGGIFQPLIHRNTPVPCEASDIFTTSIDYQDLVNVHVLQGEREMAADNISLARFELFGIPPLLRGMPQIEVKFKIDANGIVSVSAKDLATGRAQSIRVEANSGISENDIQRMIDEAQKQREQDQLRKDKVQKINELKGLLYMSQRSVNELGVYLSSEAKEDATQRIAEFERYLNEGERLDDESINALKHDLESLARELSEAAFAAMSSS
ncbi:MAG: molecular chaperone DnaK [Bradymonadales bacterium]|jgi:molecular chaperone DnaK